MTDEATSGVETGASSRRTFMKGAAGVASAALATTGLGTAVAQDDGVDESWEGLIFADNFHPEARFTFVSGIVEWTPNYGDVRDSWFTDYDTYQIRWLNTDEVVPLFVAQAADVGEYDQDLGFVPDADDADQPQLYEMNQEWSPFGDNPRLVTVNFSPVGEDEEDRILENEDWWQADGNGTTTPGNGTASPTPGNQSVFDG